MTEQRPAELPDAHLVEMAQRDPTAFVHLYDRYVDQIYRYCAQRLTQTAAEDATSVAFLNALRAIEGSTRIAAGSGPGSIGSPTTR